MPKINIAMVLCTERHDGPAHAQAVLGGGAAFDRSAWIAVDSPDCRRALTLLWGADSNLSTAARLMRTTITGWNWITGEPQ
ncbi:hypothetical protein [Nonomuraea sp. NPDC049141]|uniref:hypothetical protein n=1 Tax=unclassified Nonomuraea TaxID=2593643 RepID=UPI0033C01203